MWHIMVDLICQKAGELLGDGKGLKRNYFDSLTNFFLTQSMSIRKIYLSNPAENYDFYPT